MSALAVVWAALTYVTNAQAAGTLPTPGTYAVDQSGSSVGFNISHFLIASVDGKFKTFSGRVTVGESLAASHLEATVDIASVDTGIQMRDEKLRTDEFFDAAKFPTMTFKSTQLWGTPDNFGIKGNLTIKGVTKEVVFTARILDTGVVVAQATINRADFGITASGPVKNEVRLRLRIQLAKSAS
jgi:polyisoprenoid-binding protein YceI